MVSSGRTSRSASGGCCSASARGDSRCRARDGDGPLDAGARRPATGGHGVYPNPPIAILPLVLVVFGIGESGKLFMVAFSVFFLMLFQTLAGVRGIEPVMLDVARSLRASRLQQYLSVAWPGALPSDPFTRHPAGCSALLLIVICSAPSSSRQSRGSAPWDLGLSYQVLDVETMYAGPATTALIRLGPD